MTHDSISCQETNFEEASLYINCFHLLYSNASTAPKSQYQFEKLRRGRFILHRRKKYSCQIIFTVLLKENQLLQKKLFSKNLAFCYIFSPPPLPRNISLPIRSSDWKRLHTSIMITLLKKQNYQDQICNKRISLNCSFNQKNNSRLGNVESNNIAIKL